MNIITECFQNKVKKFEFNFDALKLILFYIANNSIFYKVHDKKVLIPKNQSFKQNRTENEVYPKSRNIYMDKILYLNFYG